MKGLTGIVFPIDSYICICVQLSHSVHGLVGMRLMNTQSSPPNIHAQHRPLHPLAQFYMLILSHISWMHMLNYNPYKYNAIVAQEMCICMLIAYYYFVTSLKVG